MAHSLVEQPRLQGISSSRSLEGEVCSGHVSLGDNYKKGGVDDVCNFVSVDVDMFSKFLSLTDSLKCVMIR